MNSWPVDGFWKSVFFTSMAENEWPHIHDYMDRINETQDYGERQREIERQRQVGKGRGKQGLSDEIEMDETGNLGEIVGMFGIVKERSEYDQNI